MIEPRDLPLRGEVVVFTGKLWSIGRKQARGIVQRGARVTGEPGLVFYAPAGRAKWVAALEIADGVVVAVRSVLNPDKLAHLRSS